MIFRVEIGERFKNLEYSPFLVKAIADFVADVVSKDRDCTVEIMRDGALLVRIVREERGGGPQGE